MIIVPNKTLQGSHTKWITQKVTNLRQLDTNGLKIFLKTM